MGPDCIFYAANGKHCAINDVCVVCKAPEQPELQKGDTIQLLGLDGLDGTYKVVRNKKGTIELEFVGGK